MSKPQLAPPSTITDLQRANRARLLQFLRYECHPEQFVFGEVAKHNECGTVGCAIGWTPKLFPNQVCWSFRKDQPEVCFVDKPATEDEWYDYKDIGAALFGLRVDVSYEAFTPDLFAGDTAFPEAGQLATPQQVADRLEYVFALHP